MNKSEKGGWIVQKQLADQYTCQTGLAYGEIDLTGAKIINQMAFWDCDGIKTLKITDQITEISVFSFLDCSNLSNVDIANSVTKIGNNAFERCFTIANFNASWSLDQLKQLTVNNFAFQNIPNLNINVKNPNNQHDELFKAYTIKFSLATTAAYKVTINVEPDKNNLAPILGGILGAIAVVGLVSGIFFIIRQKRSKLPK